MGEVVRAKTSTADWCKPTAELSTRDLAELLPRARRESQPAVPVLGDSWFQDSAPIELVPAMIIDRPPQPEPKIAFHEPAPREPRPRTAMQRLTSRIARRTQAARPVAYPIAPASHAWVWVVMGVIVTTLAVAGALVTLL